MGIRTLPNQEIWEFRMLTSTYTLPATKRGLSVEYVQTLVQMVSGHYPEGCPHQIRRRWRCLFCHFGVARYKHLEVT